MCGCRPKTSSVTGQRGGGVTMTTLTNERTFIGSGVGVGDAFGGDIVRLARELRQEPLTQSSPGPGRAYIRLQLLKYLGWRIQTAISRNNSRAPRARSSSWGCPGTSA